MLLVEYPYSSSTQCQLMSLRKYETTNSEVVFRFHWSPTVRIVIGFFDILFFITINHKKKTLFRYGDSRTI